MRWNCRRWRRNILMCWRIATHVQHGGALAVCATGLIFAAETGLLQQARLDAHWAFKSFFMRIVPQADFRPAKRSA
jgi:transcriptional regulator GlxA family with amidase domain